MTQSFKTDKMPNYFSDLVNALKWTINLARMFKSLKSLKFHQYKRHINPNIDLKIFLMNNKVLDETHLRLILNYYLINSKLIANSNCNGVVTSRTELL